MTLLDTNILIRFFTNDALDQATYARQIFALAKPGELVITDAVLSEFCFVLQFNKLYLFERPFINDALEMLVKQHAVSLTPTARKAISYFQANPKLDFVDCLLIAQAHTQKVPVESFDKRLLKTLATEKA